MTSKKVELDLGEWVAEMEWPEGQTQGGPVTLLVRPADPDAYPTGGLSSTVLRRINFREASALLQRQRTAGTVRQKVLDRLDAKRLDRLRVELSNGITTDYLALLSSVYLARVNRGLPKVVESIAEDLGKGLQTIRGHLWQARNQGLLIGAQGRKGGKLSPEAWKIVDTMFPSGLVSMSDMLKNE